MKFVEGLFQETLPSFLDEFSQSNNNIIINIDSDIYTSALYVLTKSHDLIEPGTIIVFDEFSSALHEFRAFIDYTEAYIRKYEVIGTSGLYLNRVAVRITE